MSNGIIEVLKYLPKRLKNVFDKTDIAVLDEINEIRLKILRPLTVTVKNTQYGLSASGNLTLTEKGCTVYKADIDFIFNRLTHESVYAFDEEIAQGFITADGGHRVGISGEAVVNNGIITGIKNVDGLYFRIAHEIKGCGNEALKFILKKGSPSSTIISAPPGKGKTTVLRDIARQLSYMNYKVSVIDERHELCAVRDGVPAFDLGNCDILMGFPKAEGIERAVRTLSPHVVIFDEIGNIRESEAVSYALNSGVACITSTHAFDLKDLMNKKIIKGLLETESVDLLLSIGFGKVEEYCFVKDGSVCEDRVFEYDLSPLCSIGGKQENETRQKGHIP